jgi:hypothetical protein
MSLTFDLAQQRVAFRQHLHAPRNHRIIFSGAFGIGKTYFLQYYFAQPDSEYVAVKLSPVNYSVAANEDIFRLIKYDILFELLATHKLKLEVGTISREVAYGVALQDKLPGILNGLMNVLPVLNKDTADVVSIWTTVSAALLPFIKETEAARRDPNLLGRLEDFGRELGKHPLFEEDFITSFIEQSLDSLATTEEQAKEKILVIDDLDRIDPEHIFRLFNVFSAHLDYNKSTSNKFGFDKVIFVCDIHNIRNIFHSRYGAETDFTGYIDKFYSQEVYHFDNSTGVKSTVVEFLDSIAPTTEQFKHYYINQIAPVRQHIRLLGLLLTELVHAGALTIRRLEARYGIGFPQVEINTGLRAHYNELSNWHLPAIITMEMLTWIVGDVEALDRALKKLIHYQRSNEYLSRTHREQGYYAATLLPLLDYAGHGFKTHNQYHADALEPHEFVNPRTKQKLSYELYLDDNSHSIYGAKIVQVDGERYNDQNTDLFGLVYEAFKLMRTQGLLR